MITITSTAWNHLVRGLVIGAKGHPPKAGDGRDLCHAVVGAAYASFAASGSTTIPVTPFSTNSSGPPASLVVKTGFHLYCTIRFATFDVPFPQTGTSIGSGFFTTMG